MKFDLRAKLGIAVVLIALVGGGTYWWTHHSTVHGRRVPNPNLSPAEQTAEEDREILKDKNSNDYEVTGALIRLTMIREPKIREELLERGKSSSKIVRAGVANAIGYFDDSEAVVTLKKFLADSEPSVRMGAIQGLGHFRNAEREKALAGHLETKGLPPDERLETSAALALSGTSKESREAALNSLIEVLHHGTLELSRNALGKITAMAPDDLKTQQVCRSVVETEKDPQKLSIAIRHLAGFDPQWIRSRLDQLSTHPNAEIRLAVVQSLHVACPDNRWNILRAMVNAEKDAGLREGMVKESLLMPTGASAFLAWVRETYQGKDPQLTKVANETIDQLKTTQNPDICAPKAAHP